jgi:hypothetical protein
MTGLDFFPRVYVLLYESLNQILVFKLSDHFFKLFFPELIFLFCKMTQKRYNAFHSNQTKNSI